MLAKALFVHGDKFDYSNVSHEHVKGSYSQIPITCNTCFYNWAPVINNHINNERSCPDCAGVVPWTLERFLEKVLVVHGNKFDYSNVLDNHINGIYSHIPVQCNKCFYNWTPTINDHVNCKHGCPKCKVSKGEIECERVLTRFDILPVSQYKVPGTNKQYDFMFIYNNNHYLLEYDGKQHFQFNEYFHYNLETFESQKQRDIVYTLNAIKFGYKIIRIDFTQKDNIQYHITEAIRNNNRYYFSNSGMYEHILKYLSSIE